MADALGFKPDVDVRVKRYKIGCIGAGMIMAEVHLAAYKEAGFQVAAIASRTPANAKKVAERYGIRTVHPTPEKLIEDPQVEILDIAFPRPATRPSSAMHCSKAHQGDPRAEAAVATSMRKKAPRRSYAAGKMILRQSKHALRPFDCWC